MWPASVRLLSTADGSVLSVPLYPVRVRVQTYFFLICFILLHYLVASARANVTLSFLCAGVCADKHFPPVGPSTGGK